MNKNAKINPNVKDRQTNLFIETDFTIRGKYVKFCNFHASVRKSAICFSCVFNPNKSSVRLFIETKHE